MLERIRFDRFIIFGLCIWFGFMFCVMLLGFVWGYVLKRIFRCSIIFMLFFVLFERLFMKRNIWMWLVFVCVWVVVIVWNEICCSLVIFWFWVVFIFWLGIFCFYERIFVFVYMFELCYIWVIMFLIFLIFVLIFVFYKNIYFFICVLVCLMLKLIFYLLRIYWFFC